MWQKIKNLLFPRIEVDSNPLQNNVDPIQEIPQFVKFEFIIDNPKIANEGEDSIYSSISEKSGIIGVFDGLGGSGSNQYNYKNQKHSGAYYASRLGKLALSDFDKLHFKDGENFGDAESILKHILINTFRSFANQYLATDSSLKGAIIRRLPTTMALWMFVLEEHSQKVRLKTLWAGDSRCYILSSITGLTQITIDDLVGNIDPYHNLKTDAPLSNFISDKNDFDINFIEKTINCCDPTILIAATDGVFHYVPTPMHFEYLLLKSLDVSKDINQWKINLKNEISRVTVDDASLAIFGFGWNNFIDLQTDFKKRLEKLSSEYITPINNYSIKISGEEKRLNQLKIEFEILNKSLWEKYQKSYFSSHNHSNE